MSTPDYYQFPYGIEPILISRHLTSNGGQILQYVARSTRLDGKNKHDRKGRMDDLRKLIDLAHDEIWRLEEEEAEEEASKVRMSNLADIVARARGQLDDENAYEEEVTYVTGGSQ